MNRHPRILSGDEYDEMIRQSARASGIDRDASDHLVANRWPMSGFDILTECAGRGLALTPQDLADYLESMYPEGECRDGEPIVPMEVWFEREHVEHLIKWACIVKRGEFTKSPAVVARFRAAQALEQVGQQPDHRHMEAARVIAGLSSPDLETRKTAAGLVYYNIDAGVVVVDKAIVPDVANLRLLAIVGDVIACDQLESLLRTGRPALLVGLGGGEPNISEAIFALRTGDERLVGRACRTIHERLIRGLWRLLGTSEDRECLFEPQAEMFEALLAGVCARDPAAIDEMEASLTDQCPIPPEPCPEPSDFPKEPEPA